MNQHKRNGTEIEAFPKWMRSTQSACNITTWEEEEAEEVEYSTLRKDHNLECVEYGYEYRGHVCGGLKLG